MDEILKQLGWDDGFRIPVANAENRALELEIEKKQKEKENLLSALESSTERVTGMKKYLDSIHHQLDQNQNLIFAHNNQKAAEENMAKLARIEDTSLTNLIKKVKKEEGEVQDRLAGLKMDIDRALQHIESLNATIKWDKDALLAWDEELSRGDDDTRMLEKFRKEDEVRYKELELKRQTLGLEVDSKRSRLKGLKNDIISLEQSLDKTAQMFRRQHIDRRCLVRQWEGSVRILHQRDEDIKRVMEEIANLKTLAKAKLKELEEQKTFFENEQKNNEEMEKEIEMYNKTISENKDKIKVLEATLLEENDHLVTLRNLLSSSASSLSKEIARHKNLTKEVEVKNQEVVELNVKRDKAKEDYENIKLKRNSAEERVTQLENMIKEEEKIVEKNTLELKNLDGLFFQVMQQINDLKNGEKGQMATMEHLESSILSTKKYIEKSKMELNRQKELLYNMDFAYTEKDFQYNKMIEVLNQKDNETYEKKLYDLEEVQRNLNATNVLLTKEVNRLEEDIRRISVDLQGDAKEENYLKSKRQENTVMIECGMKQLKLLRSQNQDKQVDENLLKLKVKQMEVAIDKLGGKLFCLEKQRLELEEAMKEREIEIKTLKDVLHVRKRVLSEQASALNSRINLAKVKVEHLKSKYDVEILKLGKDEHGQPLSLAYFKVKGAQEKFELQEMGDKLDLKIKKTEKEIEAMENTLKVVNATNKIFKNNLQSLEEDSPEQVEKRQLQEAQGQVYLSCRKKKAELESLRVITLDLEEEYQEKLRMEEDVLKSWTDKDQLAGETDRDLRDQEEKLERAGKQLRRLIKEIRGTKISKFKTIHEKDIELRELMDQNEFGLQQLAELAAQTYDIGPVITQYLDEKGLTLPTIRSPAPSLKCPSTASVASARSYVSSKSSKSSDSTLSATPSCIFTPSIITLDSSRLCEKTSSSEVRKPCGLKRSSEISLKKASESTLKKTSDSDLKKTSESTLKKTSDSDWRKASDRDSKKTIGSDLKMTDSDWKKKGTN